MSTVSEMEDGYASGGYAPVEPQVTTMPDASITVSSVPEPADPSLVSAYAQSISPVTYQGGDAIAKFDVVFSVACTCPDSGNLSTYQVVKRIGIDRAKIGQEARNNVPVSIVEAAREHGFHLSTADTKKLAGL
jgi:hypothetical protein